MQRCPGLLGKAMGSTRGAGPVSGMSAQAFHFDQPVSWEQCVEARAVGGSPAAGGSPEDDFSGDAPRVGPRG